MNSIATIRESNVAVVGQDNALWANFLREISKRVPMEKDELCQI
jgi:hypothetical protein